MSGINFNSSPAPAAPPPPPPLQVLYATDTTSNLYSVNPTTAVRTLIGATGIANMHDLAFDPTSGTLYGVADNGGNPALYTINTTTGAATLVGTDLGSVCPPASLVFDMTGAGYQTEGVNCSGGQYNSINKTTGALSGITTLGTAGGGAPLVQKDGGLAYYANGGSIYPITLATGSLGSAVGLTGGIDVRSMTEYSGTIYGVQNDGTGMGTLCTIDPATGAVTTIGASQSWLGLGANFITATPIAVDGASVQNSQAEATMDTGIAVGGNAQQDSQAQGTLLTPITQVSGNAVQNSSASGTITTPFIFLVGDATQNSVASGTVFLPEVFIDGNAEQNSQAQGALEEQIAIEGSAVQNSQAQADLGIVKQIAGHAIQNSQASAEMFVIHYVVVQQSLLLDSQDAGNPLKNEIGFQSTGVGINKYRGENILTFSQTPDWAIDAVESVQQNLNFNQSTALFVTNAAGTVILIIDENGNIVSPCDCITESDFIIGGVNLGTPDFPDSHISDNNVVQTESRAGAFLQTENEFLAQGTQYEFIFSNITEGQKSALQILFAGTLGTPVAVQDHRSYNFNAVVLNPETAFAEGKEDECGNKRFDVTLRLEEIP